MPTTIKLKNSVTTTNSPSTLQQGEVAINVTDRKVWVGNAATTPVQLLGAGATGSFSALSCTSLTNSGLTSGRITYAGTGGLLQDDADFTFNGTTVTMANDASISGLTVGRGGGALTGNTAIGNIALPANTTGSFNSAFGYGALFVNTTGSFNTAIGRETLKSNTTGDGNTALGILVLQTNTTGVANVGVGNQTLQANTTGGYNTALGLQSLYSNTTASNNTAVGYQSLYTNITTVSNTALGYQSLYLNVQNNNTAVGFQAGRANTTGTIDAFGLNALYQNTTGSSNVAVGQSALQANTTASNNTAVGYQAGYSNTTTPNSTCVGYQAGFASTINNLTAIGSQAARNNTTGWNTAVGMQALFTNTTGTSNIAIGGNDGNVQASLYSNTTGSNNTAVGAGTLQANTTASNNTAVGYQAGYVTTGINNTFVGSGAGAANTTGLANCFIGRSAGAVVTTGTRNTIIGAYDGNNGGLDIRTASNYIVISDGDGNPRVWHDGSSFNMAATTPSGNYFIYTGTAFYPSADNVCQFGASDKRLTTIFAVTGTINTSDANQKQQIRSLDNAEKAVAQSIKGLIKAFKFNDAVTKKGENARIHVGVIAQEVHDAFVAEGLDPTRYAMFCSDTWYEIDGKSSVKIEEPFTADMQGAVKVTRLGVRYDQLLAFVISAI